MFCPHCNAQINDNAKFCPGCGAATAAAGPAQAPYNQRLVGFSQKIHDPVFENLQKARFRKRLIMGVIWLPAAILLFQIVPFFADDFPRQIALAVGCIVGGFGLIYTLIHGAKRSSAGTWDGEVIDKKITTHDHSDQDGNYDTFYHHTIIFRLANGKKKKMLQKSRSGAYSTWDMMTYLDVGDKVRYHGKLNYYEKYDKSRDTEAPCANCRVYVDLRMDVCPNCGVPVIKP